MVGSSPGIEVVEKMVRCAVVVSIPSSTSGRESSAAGDDRFRELEWVGGFAVRGT